MPRNEQPWIKFYYRKWLESERVWRMSPAGQGLYMKALALQSRDGNIPADPDLLALAMQIKATDMAAWPEALAHFQEEVVNKETRLFNLKLRAELEATKEKSKKRAEAGKEGGSKKKANATAKEKDSKSESESKASPRASISNSYSKSPECESDFNTFYGLYPVKKKRARALEAWKKAVESHELALQIVDHVKDRKDKDPQWLEGFVEHPTTFLNGRLWEDQYTAARRPGNGRQTEGDRRNAAMAQHDAPKSAPLSEEEAELFNKENAEFWREVAAQ